MKTHNLLLAGLLVLSPVTRAIAQGSTSPDLKADSTREADAVKNGSGTSPNKAGATGSTTVAGDHSTVAGDQKATDRVKSGGGGGGK